MQSRMHTPMIIAAVAGGLTGIALVITVLERQLAPIISGPPTIEIPIADVTNENLGVISNMVASPLAQPMLVVALRDGARTGNVLLRLIEPAHETALTALLAANATQIFGDVSPRYDVLPLSEGETTLAVAPGMRGSGLSFFIEGTASDTAKMHERLGRLRVGARARAPASVREEFTISETQTFTLLRAPTEHIAETRSTRQGWEVIEFATEDYLATMTRGNRFVLTNDPAAIDQFFSGTHASVRLPGRASALVAGGVIDPKFAQSMSAIISPLPSVAQHLQTLSGMTLWSIERRDEGYVLLLQKN